MKTSAFLSTILLAVAFVATSLSACSKDPIKAESQEKTVEVVAKTTASPGALGPPSTSAAGGAVGQTASLVTAKSPDCLRCVKKNCPDNLDSLSCEALAGTASAGPAAGQSKASLCLSLLSCELKKNCGGCVRGASTCYCGTIASNCFTAGGNGSCVSEEQAGLESTSLGTLQSAFG